MNNETQQQLRNELIQLEKDIFQRKLDRIKELGLKNPAENFVVVNQDGIDEVLREHRSLVRFHNKQIKYWTEVVKSCEESTNELDKLPLKTYRKMLEENKQKSKQESQIVKELKYYWNE